MASIKQLFSTFPGPCHLSSNRHHSYMESESHILALGGKACSYSCTTRGSTVINNFQNNIILLFFSYSLMAVAKTQEVQCLYFVLKFASVIEKRRGDTNRI